MIPCPHCGAQHDEQAGRFCESCGMSVVGYAKPEPVAAAGGEELLVRCRSCGIRSPLPVCLACGSKLPLPDDWEEE